MKKLFIITLIPLMLLCGCKKEQITNTKTLSDTTYSITADCDNDALLILVDKEGPACHTGSDSCFTKPVFESEERNEFSPQILFNLIEGRKIEKKEGSYTTYLFEKGIDKILKKEQKFEEKNI